MKRFMILAALALLGLLLAGCAADVSMEDGEPGYASGEIGLVTDGRRVVMERQGSWWSEDASVIIEVTGGSERFVDRVYHLDDMAVSSGKIWVTSHTQDLLSAQVVSHELDRYNLTLPAKNTLHITTEEDQGMQIHAYALCSAADGPIRYGSTEEGEYAFARVDADGEADDPFLSIPVCQYAIMDTYIACVDLEREMIEICDPDSGESYEFPLLWRMTGRDGDGRAPQFPRGVLLEGKLWYLKDDGVWEREMESGEEKRLAEVAAPEYFYVTDGFLYTAADDGLLTAWALSTGEMEATDVEMTKGERFVVAGENVYILQTPDMHDVTEESCLIVPLRTE